MSAHGGHAPSPLWAVPSWEGPKLSLRKSGENWAVLEAVRRAPSGCSGANLKELGLPGGSWQFHNSKKQIKLFTLLLLMSSFAPSPPTSHSSTTLGWARHQDTLHAFRCSLWELVQGTTWLQDSGSCRNQIRNAVFSYPVNGGSIVF